MNDVLKNHLPAWVSNARVYHFYPLGTLGAEHQRHGDMDPIPRLRNLIDWIPHLKNLGCNTILLGPIWKSETHGYDTTDLLTLDPRLGTNDDLWYLVKTYHEAGFKVILDGVFNHVGRSHFAFNDIKIHGQNSRYKTWFKGLRFGERSPLGDDFVYDTWDGHWHLVKLDYNEPEVLRYILDVVKKWVSWFDIDGLRLDAADVVDPMVWRELRYFTGEIKEDFWLLGEQVFGDYNHIAGAHGLHGTTNYEAYKSLWSSYNEKNMHELSYALKRQFQEPGIYKHLSLLSFVDNHDVNRIASVLKDHQGLYALHALLYTMPGVPCLYYGSEVGLEGTKQNHDWPLRPNLAPKDVHHRGRVPELAEAIGRLARLRESCTALQAGSYREVKVEGEALAFIREDASSRVLVLVNYKHQAHGMELPLGALGIHQGTVLSDILNPWDQGFVADQGVLRVEVPPTWARVLVLPR